MQDESDIVHDLFLRINPKKVLTNVETLSQARPDLADILATINKPSRICHDALGREFLGCDYNIYNSSFRSPWQNEWIPPLNQESDAPQLNEDLRQLELALNDAFGVYTDLYYETGISSVYVWESESGFSAIVIIRKTLDDHCDAFWESSHVFQVEENESTGTTHYSVTSSILLDLTGKVYKSDQSISGSVSLAGCPAQQTDRELKYSPSPLKEKIRTHVSNMGSIVEDVEQSMRHSIQDVYFSKTRDILDLLRCSEGYEERERQANFRNELRSRLSKRSS